MPIRLWLMRRGMALFLGSRFEQSWGWIRSTRLHGAKSALAHDERGSAFERIFRAGKGLDSTGISFHKVAG
jgi:hypothetical protein